MNHMKSQIFKTLCSFMTTTLTWMPQPKYIVYKNVSIVYTVLSRLKNSLLHEQKITIKRQKIFLMHTKEFVWYKIIFRFWVFLRWQPEVVWLCSNEINWSFKVLIAIILQDLYLHFVNVGSPKSICKWWWNRVIYS